MKEIIEQLKTEAPEFFSQEELDKHIANAKARYQSFIRKSFPSLKLAMDWTDEMLKQKYKLLPERCNLAGHSVFIALTKPPATVKSDLELLITETESAYRNSCEEKLSEWLNVRIEEVTEANRQAELAAVADKEAAFKQQILMELRNAN